MSLESKLREIKERASKATPGPWVVDKYNSGVMTLHPDHQTVSRPTLCPEGEPDICSLDDGEYIENTNAAHDANFIAHARTDVPWLVEACLVLARAVEAQRELENYVNKVVANYNRYYWLPAASTSLNPVNVADDLSRKQREAYVAALRLLETGEVPQ